MATVKFSVPDWAQSLIARAAGLDPCNLVVRLDNDSIVVFLQHMPRTEFCVNKKTGEVRQF